MSGVELEAAVGLISGIIAIIQAVKQISDNVKDAANLPEAFREMGKRLPIVLSTLQIAQSQIERNADEESCHAMNAVMTNCNSNLKTEQLRRIFDAVARSPDASRIECYRKAVRQWSKGKLVEVLAKDMIEDVRVLAMNRSIRAATKAQVAEFLKAIEDLANIEPSLSDGSSFNQHHYGSGDNIGGNKHEGNSCH
ncbi:hypothetical protein N7493_010433 [Penicillium malachiteum]|uniref:NACHT-NTPase and P-loop NTPases N-terminal domain-containing protein n=1 Tax=Penicillium malachiteum TaxID=1324776 RepID=A0AAD6HCP6_9EURO|nr:hypothetical protein N7493_010433 [Penicillium malachiteum]